MTTRTWAHQPTCKWTDEGQLDITGFPEDMPMCLQFYLTSIRPEKWPRAMKLIQQGEGHCFANEIGILFPLDYESSSSEEDQPSRGPIPEDEVEFFAGYFPKDRVKKSVFLHIVQKCLEERNKTFCPLESQDEFLDYVRRETRSKDYDLPELGSTGIKRTTSVDSLESMKTSLRRTGTVHPFLDTLDLATNITQEDTNFWAINPNTKKLALRCRRLRQELDTCTGRLKTLESKLEISENRLEMQENVVQRFHKLITGLQQEQETVQKVLLDEKTKNEELTEAIKSMETTINDLLDQKTKLANKLAMVESDEQALTKAPEEPGRSTQVKSAKADVGGDVHTAMALSKPSSPDPVYTPGTARGAKLAALLVDEGTALVRKIFEDEVQKMNPPSLREQLQRNKRYLCGLRHLNPGQRKTLYPASGDVPDTAQGFDISLLELLLKELCQNAPYSGERDRLRWFRNDNYGRISSTELSEQNFGKLWKELAGILVTLGGDRDKISERLSRSIDPEQEAKLKENLKNKDIEVKRFLENLKEGHEGLKEGQDSLKEGQDSLKEGQDSLKEAQDSMEEGQDGLKEGQDSLKEAQDGMEEGKDGLKEGQGSLKKGQESLKEGQDSLKKGHDGLTEGQDSLKERQGNLKEGQDSLNEGQDSMEGGQDGLKEAQDGLKEGHILEHVLTNQSQGMSTKPRAESSHQMDQLNAGSTDLVDDVIASLKDLYATEYAHVRPLPWCEDLSLPLGDVYTNLQLQYREGRGRFQDTGTIVSLVDIYDTREGEVSVNSAVRKVRVEGGPGIGKSCSCQKLAYDWSCGKLDKFKVVFFLEMRHIAGKVKDEIFEQLLPPDTKTTPDQLWSYIQENQDDVLFILDGLDELSQAAREVTDVVDLIQGKILRNCHVLVTSRPNHCVKDLEKCDQFYKILGYSKKDSEEFIHKYFCKSPESGLELVKQLQINRSLSEIVVNPLNNVLICVVFEDNNKKLLSSKDELYRDIVHSVAKRFCTKNYIQMEGDKLPPHIEEALRGLGKLSWEGLEQETLQFNIDEIREKYGTTADNMLNMGLLTRDYSFSRIKRTCYCAFLHITFQEYMAARYISGLIMDGGSKDEGMECVCRLFGMSDAAVVDRKLITSCHSRYREVQNWLLLILGENSRPLFARFEEELNKAQTDDDRAFLSFYCVKWLDMLGTTCAGGEMASGVYANLCRW